MYINFFPLHNASELVCGVYCIRGAVSRLRLAGKLGRFLCIGSGKCVYFFEGKKKNVPFYVYNKYTIESFARVQNIRPLCREKLLSGWTLNASTFFRSTEQQVYCNYGGWKENIFRPELFKGAKVCVFAKYLIKRNPEPIFPWIRNPLVAPCRGFVHEIFY